MKNNLTRFITTLVLLAALAITIPMAAQPQANKQANSGPTISNPDTFSAPPDLTSYTRPVVPQDYSPGGKPALPLAPVSGTPIFPSVYVADPVVNNTDPSLTNSDHFGDSEPSIALNPATCVEPNVAGTRGCQEIVLLAFSGGWAGPGSFAPLWHATTGGILWTKENTIPIPPNAPGASGCPCDQTPDYGSDNQMSSTFLTAGSSGTNVYSGTTTNPANGAQWNWLISGGVAQPTNSFGVGSADQPWLLVNGDPANAAQNDVYVDYDDFSGAPDMRVAASYGLDPPKFTVDSLDGFSTGGVNPGHRLTVDHRNGAVYGLFQRCSANCGGNPKTINYMLNRSMNGGMTWGLNGSPTGVVVATGQSTQPGPKFGTVNALLGGVDHAAVDPRTGDVYVVYGNRDAGTGNNRLSIVRLTDDGIGGLTIGPSFFVTGQVQAALPSVAVSNDSKGSVGVLYDTFDGIDSGLPIFSAHLAMSSDRGKTFQDVTLETFLSPAKDNGDSRQRVLGDYQQLKSVGTGFYGVFAGNGVPFGRPFSNTDPIFFKTFVEYKVSDWWEAVNYRRRGH
jgi:hypothetical protein